MELSASVCPPRLRRLMMADADADAALLCPLGNSHPLGPTRQR